MADCEPTSTPVPEEHCQAEIGPWKKKKAEDRSIMRLHWSRLHTLTSDSEKTLNSLIYVQQSWAIY